MNCPNCKNLINEHSALCDYCGTYFLKVTEQFTEVNSKKAKRKAFKFTIYVVVLILSIINLSTKDLGDFQLIYVTAPPILIYELYLFLTKKYSNMN